MKYVENLQESSKMFRITDRTFHTILETLRLKENDILDLPNQAVVLEVGSGTNQAFSRALKEVRPDVLCISLDPTLAIKPEDFVTNVTDWNQNIPTAIFYDNYSENTPSEQAYSARIRDVRIQEAINTGNVLAGLAPDLPIKSDTIDLLIDSWAAGYYLDKGSEKFTEYIKDISRVLKQEGSARLFPVYDRQKFNLDIEHFRKSFPELEIEIIQGDMFLGLNISKR